MNTKRTNRVVLLLTVASWVTACQGEGGKLGDASPASSDSRSETKADSPPSDAKSPGDSAQIADAPAADGADLVPAPDADARDVAGLDGLGPRADAPANDIDAATADLRPDRAHGEAAPPCAEGTTEACASPGNPLLGACRAGTRTCSGGVWGPCDEVLPAASESCNGIDDDCNGMIDEGCSAGCIVVCGRCASADDASAPDGTVAHPFPTVEAAMAAAVPADGGAAQRRICIVGGATCRESTLYPMSGTLKMRDGLVIQGAYAITDNGLEYCPGANLRPRTTLSFASSEGVVFDQSIVAGAELSSVFIELNPPADPGKDIAETGTAVAIKGGKNVTLGRVFVSEGFAAAHTYGVAVTAGGQATIAGSAISAGQGKSSAVGVYVNGASANLRNNCDRIVDGRCASYCDDGGSMLGMHGYLAANVADAPAESSAVLVSGASSVSLAATMVCAGSSQLADGQSPAIVAALRCEGGGCTKVSGNVIKGGTDRDALAVALVGAAPLFDGNLVEGGCGSRSTTAVWLEGSSARLQNNRILGGQCEASATPTFYALHLLSNVSGGPDVHSNDIEPLGLSGDCQSIGILVERGSAASGVTAGVLRNNIVSAGVCSHAFAISEADGASLQALHNNDLYAPKGDGAATSVVLYRHAGVDLSTAAQVNAVAVASGNISTDPAYASYPRDLHLTADSACIDKGTSEAAPTSDAEGTPRPAGLSYDIGAYEMPDP